MKAAVFAEDGLRIQNVSEPEPEPSQVLVKVHTSGLNRADLGMAAGRKHGNMGGAGGIAGLEWAGEIVAIGAEVDSLKIGDRVMCTGSGGYAEYAVSDWGRTIGLPPNSMNYEQAVTLPIALMTMHNALVTAGNLEKGDAVVIQGASSGVGLMGMQIAKYLGAGLVIGTSTNLDRRNRLGEFGADLALDSSDPGWVNAVLDATDGKGADLIVDQISAGVMNHNLEASRILGRIVNVGRLGGYSGEFDFDLHAKRRINYIGVTFRTRSVEEVREINRLMRKELWGALEEGKLTLPVDKVFPLDEVAKAQAYMRDNNHFGKIVLRICD